MKLLVENAGFRNQRFHASRLRVSLDKQGGLSDKSVLYAKSVLNDCLENPTIGMMAIKRDFNSVGKIFPKAFKRNKKELLKNPEISSLINEFESKFKNDLYKRSWKTRVKIIDDERIVFYGVKPARTLLKTTKGLFSKMTTKIFK